jgi:hypothetical protein
VTLEFGPLAKVGTAKFSEAKFSPAELDSLMAAAADPNALYRLRFVPESPAPSPAQQPVQTFTRAVRRALAIAAVSRVRLAPHFFFAACSVPWSLRSCARCSPSMRISTDTCSPSPIALQWRCARQNRHGQPRLPLSRVLVTLPPADTRILPSLRARHRAKAACPLGLPVSHRLSNSTPWPPSAPRRPPKKSQDSFRNT